MKWHGFAVFLSFVLAVVPAAAKASCDNLPVPVRNILTGLTGWSVLNVSDLDAEDRKFWTEAHPQDCPGVAAVKLEAGRAASFALSLYQHREGKVFWQFLIVRATPTGYVSHAIIAPEESRPDNVVSRAAPGAYYDYAQDKKVHIKTDGIVMGPLGAGALLYFLEDNEFRHINLSE